MGEAPNRLAAPAAVGTVAELDGAEGVTGMLLDGGAPAWVFEAGAAYEDGGENPALAGALEAGAPTEDARECPATDVAGKGGAADGGASGLEVPLPGLANCPAKHCFRRGLSVHPVEALPEGVSERT